MGQNFSNAGGSFSFFFFSSFTSPLYYFFSCWSFACFLCFITGICIDISLFFCSFISFRCISHSPLLYCFPDMSFCASVFSFSHFFLFLLLLLPFFFFTPLMLRFWFMGFEIMERDGGGALLCSFLVFVLIIIFLFCLDVEWIWYEMSIINSSIELSSYLKHTKYNVMFMYYLLSYSKTSSHERAFEHSFHCTSNDKKTAEVHIYGWL